MLELGLSFGGLSLVMWAAGRGPARGEAGQPALPSALAVVGLVVLTAAMAGDAPLDEDDWYMLGAARWLGQHFELWPLFTEFTNPREPVFRPLNFLWFGALFALLGTKWWAWHLVSTLLQLAIAGVTVGLGRRLGLAATGAQLAGALMLVHPALVESVVWINAQETQLLVLLCLLAVRAGLSDRWLAAALLALAAVHVKEQGAMVPALIALARAVAAPPVAGTRVVQWGARTVGWPGLAAGLAVLAALIYRRMVLHEPDNAEHAVYLQHFLDATLGERLEGALVVLSTLWLPTFGGLGPPGLSSAVAVGLSVLLAMAARSVPRREAGLVLAVAAAWALLATLPALSDVDRPALVEPPGVTPSANLRHLLLAVVGPALAVGRLMEGASALLRGGLVVGSAALLALNTSPYERIAQRLDAGLETLRAAPIGPEVGVRFVEPRDTIAAALRYGPWADPELPRVPVLVGEPRCGCAMPPPPPVPAAEATGRTSRIRAFSEAFYSVHASASAILPVGGECRCPRWRADARFVRLVGPEAGPFTLVPDR